MKKVCLLVLFLSILFTATACSVISGIFGKAEAPPTIEQPQPVLLNVDSSSVTPSAFNGWEPQRLSPTQLLLIPRLIPAGNVYNVKNKNSNNTKLKDVGNLDQKKTGNTELKKSGNADSFNDNKRAGQKSGNTETDTKLKDVGNTTEETNESWLNFGSVTALLFGLAILIIVLRWLSPTIKNWLPWFK